MVLTYDDSDIIQDFDKGYIHFIKFKVTKTILNDNESYYEGISKDGTKERYISLKNNQNGFGGHWFKFILDNEEPELVKGPFHDSKLNILK